MSVQLHPPLRVEDAEVLWHFEIENRAWFERWVGPRPDTYWELGSLTKFIEAQLADPDAMYLVWDGATLLGRVNLTGIAQGVAQLGGYRIGEAHVGRGGVASAAVAIAWMRPARWASGRWKRGWLWATRPRSVCWRNAAFTPPPGCDRPESSTCGSFVAIWTDSRMIAL